MPGIFCGVSRNQPMAPGFYYSVSCTWNAFTFAFAYDVFGIFCEICRNQSMAPRFYYSDSCTCERQEYTETCWQKGRLQERLTDKQKHSYMSHPFSLFPFHAKPSLTRPTQGFCWHRLMARCICPVQKMIVSLRVFFHISGVQGDYFWGATSFSYCVF